MSAAFNLHVSRFAQRDIEDIIERIAVDFENTAAAIAVDAAFQEGLDRLRHFADSCPPADESRLVDFDLLVGLFGTRYGQKYRMLFVIEGEAVYVLRIRGERQQALSEAEVRSAHRQRYAG